VKLGWRFLPSAREEPGAEPDWIAARAHEIERALARALALPSGGWYALDATRRIGRRPRAFQVAGEHLVAWRHAGELFVAPEACPHMGASLAGARTCAGSIVCPWHGLELGARGHGAWRPLPAHDDGVLAWVRLAREGEAATPAPILARRPARFLDGVIRVEARCEPRDVLANRLDPWHGRHFHPCSFAALEVLARSDDAITVRVEKRIAGPVRVAVDATFHCPDPRTIVMTIEAGEGAGSVVETHATPLAPGRTAIVEATLAASPRPGFRLALPLARLVHPFVERSARRLWIDDAAYAERLAELRSRPGSSGPAPDDAGRRRGADSNVRVLGGR
jgi:isorenieratene synthase